MWKSVCLDMMMLLIGFALTGSETALVNPGMHVCALILERLELIGGFLDLVFEILDLIYVGSEGIIEGLGQWIGCGFHCCRSDWTGVHIGRTGGHRACARWGVIGLVASGRGSKGLQFILRIESARILSVFVGWTLYLLRVVIVSIFGIGSGIH